MLLILLSGMCAAVTLAVFFMVISVEILDSGATPGMLLGWFWFLTFIGGMAALTSVDVARESPFRLSLRTVLPAVLWGLLVAGCLHAPIWVFRSMSFLRLMAGMPPIPFFELEVALPLSVIALIAGVVAYGSLASVATSPRLGSSRET